VQFLAEKNAVGEIYINIDVKIYTFKFVRQSHLGAG
jgi:hypothetical protein